MFMDVESEEKSNEDFDGTRWRKKTEAEIAYEQYWKNVIEWMKLPMLKCPYCKFQNVYQKSIDHHIRYSHPI